MTDHIDGIASRADRPTLATPAPPKLATVDVAATALSDMQELVAFVARDDSEGAARLAERVLVSLEQVLGDYGLELAEVFPRKRCVDCTLEVADYRMTVGADGKAAVVCMPCTTERAADAHAAKANVLELAASAVAARAPVYGNAKPNFERIGQLWGPILGIPAPTAAQVTLCMIAVKISRLVATPTHVDSWVDTAGYADLGAKVAR